MGQTLRDRFAKAKAPNHSINLIAFKATWKLDNKNQITIMAEEKVESKANNSFLTTTSKKTSALEIEDDAATALRLLVKSTKINYYTESNISSMPKGPREFTLPQPPTQSIKLVKSGSSSQSKPGPGKLSEDTKNSKNSLNRARELIAGHLAPQIAEKSKEFVEKSVELAYKEGRLTAGDVQRLKEAVAGTQFRVALVETLNKQMGYLTAIDDLQSAYGEVQEANSEGDFRKAWNAQFQGVGSALDPIGRVLGGAAPLVGSDEISGDLFHDIGDATFEAVAPILNNAAWALYRGGYVPKPRYPIGYDYSKGRSPVNDKPHLVIGPDDITPIPTQYLPKPVKSPDPRPVPDPVPAPIPNEKKIRKF